MKTVNKVSIDELGENFTIFGAKGNLLSGTSHAYKNGVGNLCGTPALSTNHSANVGEKMVVCPACLALLEIE